MPIGLEIIEVSIRLSIPLNCFRNWMVLSPKINIKEMYQRLKDKKIIKDRLVKRRLKLKID